MKSLICFGLLLLAGTRSYANSAVSGTNGKLGAMYGSMDSSDTGMLEGSITWPFLDSYGIQIDGLYSTMEEMSFGFGKGGDIDLGGVGAHFFRRDSENFLLGLESGYVFGDSVDSWEVGLEAEYYFDWLTLGGKAGFASISYDFPATSIKDDALFCQLYLAAYPVDNLQVAAFIENRFDNTYFSIEVEYQLPVRGLSLFANAMQGDHGYDHAFVGMRYYFGEDKPLKSRHRQDDPRNVLTGIRHGIGTWQAEIGEKISKPTNVVNAGAGGSIGGSGTIGGGTLTIGPGYGGSLGGSGTIGGQPGGGTLTVGPGNGGPLGGTLNPVGQPGGGTLTLSPGTITLGGGPATGGTVIYQPSTGTLLPLSSFNAASPGSLNLPPQLGSGATIHFDNEN